MMPVLVSIALFLAAFATIAAIASLHEIKRLRREIARQTKPAHLGASAALSNARALTIDRIRRTLEDRGVAPRLPLAFHAPEGEDVFLCHLFELKPAGVFLEVGAVDGVRFSVTHILESIGWTGVLIEPAPDGAEACAHNRPNATTVHAALSRRGSTGTTPFTVLPSHDGQGDAPDSFIGTLGEGKKVSQKRRQSARTVDVPLTTMNAVLEEHAPANARIDAAIIDVEGSEADLLDGFDLARWQPRVVVIEDLSFGGSASSRSTVTAAGYTLAGRIGRNDVFVHHTEPELAERARMLLAWR